MEVANRFFGFRLTLDKSVNYVYLVIGSKAYGVFKYTFGFRVHVWSSYFDK